jgi:hypothetical protein
MSIAIVAPQKFEFQDRVCVLLMLLFSKQKTLRFRVEPAGGEDAQMELASDNPLASVEIQVKGEAGTISIESLAKWLAHFPELKSEGALFERLVADQNRYILLILSGRCADSVAKYVVSLEWAGAAHANSKVRVQDAEDLKKTLMVINQPTTSDSKLESARKMHIRTVISSIKESALRQALKRLIIFERLDETAVRMKCEDLLRKNFRISPDKLDEVIEALRCVVTAAKTSQDDAIPALREVLARYKPEPLRPEGYIKRGDEMSLMQELSQNRLLLVSGPPRLGKTSVTRWIAAELADKGFQIKETTDLKDAERFLLEPVDVPRLALVDDPFGGTRPEPNPAGVLSRLNALIPRLAANRRLIVAQAQDRLLEVTRKKQLSEVRCSGAVWQNLVDQSKDLSCALWTQLANQYRIGDVLQSSVLNGIQDGKIVLDPGCLVHLAVNHMQIDDPVDMSQIERLARQDATDLGRALAGEKLKPILMSLAVSTVPGVEVCAPELAFISGEGDSKLPGQSNVIGTMVEFGSLCKRSISVPAYESPPHLTEEQESALESLELRRLLARSEFDHFSFTHPFYRSAAESLFDGATRSGVSTALSLLERGIFCLSPWTSTSAAKNIEWIFHQLDSNGKKAVATCAAKGLKSIFPTTRDVCFSFLMRNFDVLPDELCREMPKWVQHVTTLSLADMEWIEGEARIPLGDSSGIIYSDWTLPDTSETEVLSELAFLDGKEDRRITSERIAKTIGYYEDNSHRMTLNAISRLLSYDTALIRAEAIGIWLCQPRTDDTKVLERIFSEEHPAICLATLTAVLLSWKDCDKHRQTQLLKGLKRLSSSPSSAAAIIGVMETFGREEYTGENTPWPIFEALMPEVLNILPIDVFINDARLYTAIGDACHQLPVESRMRLVGAWIGLVERIAVRIIPSDFILGVVDVLITATKGYENLRADSFRRLLTIHGTGAQLRIVANLVDAWDDLTNQEKALLSHRLREPRIDLKWLQAVTLTRRNVPHELEKTILLGDVELRSEPNLLLKTMDGDLLRASACVYMGNPQPLWYIGTHHSGRDVWEPIIEEIARSPTHPLFSLAWEHITFEGKGKRVATFVTALGSVNATQVFKQLMLHKLRTNGDFMPEAWETLLKLAPDVTTRSAWLAEMASHASTVLNDFSDIKSWIPTEHQKEFISHLSTDLKLLELLNKLCEVVELSDKSSELRLNVEKLLTEIFEQRSPSILGTYDRITKYINRMGFSNTPLANKFKLKRTEFINTRSEWHRPDEEKPRFWIW